MPELKHKIEVNRSLSVQPTTVSPFGPGAWIERNQGGLIGVQLEEIGDLVAALTEAAARLRAYLAGEEYLDTLY